MAAEAFQPDLSFEAAGQAAQDGDALVIDLDGWEGPLHVLLALARNQKVDLLRLSITRLAEQYLAFVHAARKRRFALAADYLVMAAWLTYLKSRLLLPRNARPAEEGPAPESMAALLAFRLRKLEAMRSAAEALKARPQLGRDVFTRGDPEALVVLPSDAVEVDLFALMRAYAHQRRRESRRRYAPSQRVEAYPLEDARERLKALAPRLAVWTALQAVAPDEEEEPGPSWASRIASTLSASLELVKDGALEARQLEPFADLFLRRRARSQPLELTP